MDVPDWLKPILQQFPIVTLCIGAMLLGVWWLNRRHKEELSRLHATAEKAREEAAKRMDAELTRMKQSDEALRAAHLAELTRMHDLFDVQIKGLQDRVRELEKKSLGRRAP